MPCGLLGRVLHLAQRQLLFAPPWPKQLEAETSPEVQVPAEVNFEFGFKTVLIF